MVMLQNIKGVETLEEVEISRLDSINTDMLNLGSINMSCTWPFNDEFYGELNIDSFTCVFRVLILSLF